jgi:hypothetical protein
MSLRKKVFFCKILREKGGGAMVPPRPLPPRPLPPSPSPPPQKKKGEKGEGGGGGGGGVTMMFLNSVG